MLSDRWNSNKNEPIKIKNYKFDDFKEFLKFIYSGECSINDENIFTILDLSEFYHINHLKELCDEYLSKLKLTEENIFKLMETSNKYSTEKMKKPLQAFFASNFSNIAKSDAFFNADILMIQDILSLDTGNVRPEKMFQAVYEWSEHQATKKKQESIDVDFYLNDAIKSIISPFLPNIQFTKMNTGFLNRYVVKRGFLFTYDELSDILDNANPNYNVTVTNSDGVSLNGCLALNVDGNAVEIIKSLKDRNSDNANARDEIFWEGTYGFPADESPLKKRDILCWYLVFFENGSIGVREWYDIGGDEYLLAEMTCNDKFYVTKNCKIEIE